MGAERSPWESASSTEGLLPPALRHTVSSLESGVSGVYLTAMPERERGCLCEDCATSSGVSSSAVLIGGWGGISALQTNKRLFPQTG